MTPRHAIEHVTTTDECVSVTWSDGHHSRFLHQWLRDNCSCDACGTSLSGQRSLSLGDFSDTISTDSVVSDNALLLHISWPDGHDSTYHADWLRRLCNCDLCRHAPGPQLQPWDASLDPDTLLIDYPRVKSDEQTLFDLMTILVTYGVVRVKDVPADDMVTLGQQLGYLHDTNYGLVLDMRVESKSWFRVMSSEAIPPHSDNVYRYTPTGISLFHCVEQIAGGGGASYYVDSLALAQKMQQIDSDAFDCLCTVPLTYHRQIPANAAMHIDTAYFKTRSTVFRRDYNGQVIGFRYHPRTIAPMTMDEQTVTRMYRARRRLEEMTEHPDLRLQFVAEPGECTIYDNHRVLHARTGFEGASGVRHFRQCHVDREEFHSRVRLLGERLGRPLPEEYLTPGL